jgi:hypothetical protein
MSSVILKLVVEALFDGTTWTDITEDVISNPMVSSGISDNKDDDRVAGVGVCRFTLNNSNSNSAGLFGYYSPGHVNCRQGFKTGLPIRISYLLTGLGKTPKWRGRIIPGGIEVSPGLYGDRRVQVTAYDWMEQASIHRLRLMAYTSSKRGDEAIALILANMPVQPQSVKLDTGYYTFTSVFDTVRDYTTAMAEFQKICMSERGYLYLRHNRESDEQLVWENRTHRDNVIAVTTVPAALSECGEILDEDGSAILDEDGSEILSDDVDELSISGYNDMSVVQGDALANRITYTAYPKNEFTGVLASTQTRIELAAGEKKEGLKLTFRDPDGSAKISAKSIDALVAGTDYTMNANKDGTGTDLSADLVVEYTAGVEGIEYSVENTGATDGYVYLQAQGTGIRLYDKVSVTIYDAASELSYGTQELKIDAPYLEDPAAADLFASTLLVALSQPYTEVKKVTFMTDSDVMKNFFVAIETGFRIHVEESMCAINEDYFVQGWEFSDIGSNDGGGTVVKFTLFLKRVAIDLLRFMKWDTEGKWDDPNYRWYW